jgi:fumarate hydratase class II
VQGLEPNRENIQKHLANSLMLVTALNPHIGYDKAAAVAKQAHGKGISLKQAAAELNILEPEAFDRLVVPEQMTGPIKPHSPVPAGDAHALKPEGKRSIP